MTCAYDISIPVSFSSCARILSMSEWTLMVMRFTWVALALAALAHYKPTRTLSFCVCAHNRTRLILAALAVVLQWPRHER